VERKAPLGKKNFLTELTVYPGTYTYIVHASKHIRSEHIRGDTKNEIVRRKKSGKNVDCPSNSLLAYIIYLVFRVAAFSKSYSNVYAVVVSIFSYHHKSA
jgi:hypothetical protein